MSGGFKATAILLFFGLVLAASASFAHEVRPAYLELRQTSADTFDVLWKVPASGEDLRLALYVRFPDGIVNVTEPRGNITAGAHLERWRIRAPNGLSGERITIDGLSSTMTDVLVRVERLDGTTQVQRLMPSDPYFVVESSPSAWQVIRTYLVLGIEHILLGIDHLLFVLALLIITRGTKRLVITVTAFTVAHSITLALATLGFVHVPPPPVEAAIALSIVFVAAEIIRSRQGNAGLTERFPWIVAFTFGLLHGFGFAGALSEIGLPQNAIPLALLFFNVGVEIGQLFFIICVLAVVAMAKRLPVSLPAWAWRIPPYAIGGVAAFWVIQRSVAF